MGCDDFFLRYAYNLTDVNMKVVCNGVNLRYNMVSHFKKCYLQTMRDILYDVYVWMSKNNHIIFTITFCNNLTYSIH